MASVPLLAARTDGTQGAVQERAIPARVLHLRRVTSHGTAIPANPL